MPIDWFTVVAQLINFLILVWLLKRFLYKPILDAIDLREKGIAALLAQAEARKAEARKESDDFQRKNATFDRERAALSTKAADDANAEGRRLLDAARKDADSLRSKRQEALRAEQREMGQDIVRWVQKEVFAIARKTLADLAATGIEERMADVFVQRLRALTGAAKEQLAAALETSAHSARVRSAFDLPPAQQAAIRTAVNESFSADVKLQFETAPELVGGIELSAGGQKVAWSIADYLATLEKSAGELVREDAKPDTTSKPEVRAAAVVAPKVVPKSEPQPVASSPKAAV